MGIGGNGLEHALEFAGQGAQRLELVTVGSQLAGVGQLAVMQQVGDLLETGIVGEVVDVVAAISEARAFLAHRADRGPAGDDAGQSTRFFLTHAGSRVRSAASIGFAAGTRSNGGQPLRPTMSVFGASRQMHSASKPASRIAASSSSSAKYVSSSAHSSKCR